MPIAADSSPLTVVLWIVVGLVVVAIVAGLLGHWLVRRGMREPFVVRLINQARDRVVDAVKQPITVAMLDQVAAVLKTGSYTRNIASALEENREELKQMVTEKIRNDPTAGRIRMLPFHERVIEAASDTTLRVIFEILADPRTDELIADLLRDNLTQLRQAVRELS